MNCREVEKIYLASHYHYRALDREACPLGSQLVLIITHHRDMDNIVNISFTVKGRETGKTGKTRYHLFEFSVNPSGRDVAFAFTFARI